MGFFSKLFGGLKSDSPVVSMTDRDNANIEPDPLTMKKEDGFYVRVDEYNEKLIDKFWEIDPYPAQFRDLRVLLRKKIRESNKIDDIEAGKYLTLRLYNLAALVCFIYGDNDGNTSVGGNDYERAVPLVKKIGDRFNLGYLGKISDSKFLSEIDYKNIEKYWGIGENLTIKQIKKIIAK